MDPVDYKNISDDISRIVWFIVEQLATISNMYVDLVSSTLPDSPLKYSIKTNLEYSYDELRNQYLYSRELLDFVASMQRLIQSTTGDTVNNYLGNNNIEVYQYFADVSAAAGFAIDSQYISELHCPISIWDLTHNSSVNSGVLGNLVQPESSEKENFGLGDVGIIPI